MITTLRPPVRRRSVLGALAAGALLAAGTGLGAEQAAAASAELQGTALVVTGDNTADRIALRLEQLVLTNLQVDFGNDGTPEATFDRASFDRIVVNARRGDDLVLIDDANGQFSDTEQTTIQGGRDDDTLAGARGSETLLGGAGDDAIDGNQGDDDAAMGEGNDTFTWDPGDGSDTVEGDGGFDTMDFRGSNATEQFEVTANRPRVRFFRNVAEVTMDIDGLERIWLQALGGADVVGVGDLRGTDLSRLYVDLAGALGGAGGDGQPDAVGIAATPGDDQVSIRPEAGRAVVRGLVPRVAIANSEAADDALGLNLLGGEDSVRLGRGLAGLIRSTISA